MTNGNGDDYGHQRRGTESRFAKDEASLVADRLHHPASLTDEQAMLGFAGGISVVLPVEIAEPETQPLIVNKAKQPVAVPLPVSVTFKEHWQLFTERICDALLYEYDRGAVFLLFTITAGAGAVHYFGLDAEPHWLQLVIPATLFSCLSLLLRDTFIRRIGLTLILAFIVGMAAAKWETQRHATPMVGGAVSTVLTARIVSMDQEAETNGKAGRWRIVADVLTTEKPHLRYAPQRLRLSTRDLPALAETGSVIKGAVRLRPHGGPVRSGQYDFAFHGFFRDIGGNGFFLGLPKLTTDFAEESADRHSWGAAFEAMIGQLRALIGGRIMQALPGEEGAVAAALISGQRAGISESTNEALRMAGLAHILSISGLHLALAAGIVMISARGFAGLFPSLSLYYPVKKIAALVSLFSSGFYLAMSGADVAAQRSFIMIAVMLCAVMFDRQALTMRNLAIAAMFSIMLTPHEILGPSFQMSYSATGALIAAFAWWKIRKKQKLDDTTKKPLKNTGIMHKVKQSLVGTIATSLVAGTASGLYAAFHFNNMAPLGMLGNALALPVISILVMPFAVIGLLMMPFGLEWLPLQVMGKGVELVKWVAHFVADLSPDLIPGLLPAPVLLLWTAAMLSAMILTSHLRALALVFLVAGGIVLMTTTLPDIVISEDARLVAVRQDGVLYVNRERPTAFTTDNWKKAYSIRQVKTPKAYDAANAEGFSCEQGLCGFDLSNGRVLAYAENEDAAKSACQIGDIVIFAFAGDLSCSQLNATGSLVKTHPSETQQIVINRQQLALKGVAEIYLEPRKSDTKRNIGENTMQNTGTNTAPAHVVFAIGAPQRPWHLYRLYSRAARNLAEWK